MTQKFEHRFVLFLDFLGFKEVVENCEEDPSKLEKILKAIKILKELGSTGPHYSSQITTQFSDSVVVSCVATEESAVFWLINDIAFALIEIVELGFLVRGALTSGSLLHNDEYLMGSAMNEAYRLESKIAQYPRVILDDSILKIAGQAKKDGHAPDEEQGYVKAYLTPDHDGYNFIDYISFDGVVAAAGADIENFPYYLTKLAEIIRIGLSHKDKKVVNKYLWLHERYRKNLKQYRKYYLVTENYNKDPDLADAFLSIPKLKNIGEKAKKRIKDK